MHNKWLNTTDEERKIFSDKIKKVANTRSDEQKKEISKKISDSLKKLDVETKEKIQKALQSPEIRKKRGLAIKKAHQLKIKNMSKDEYNIYVETRKESGRKSGEARRKKKLEKING